MEHVDASDGVERHSDVEIEVASFRVINAEAVDEDEGLLEGGAADGEVGLHAFAGASLNVERGIGAEEVDGRVSAGGQIARGEDVNGAIAFGEGERFDGGGDLDGVDHNGFCGGGLRRLDWQRPGCGDRLLTDTGYSAEQAEGEAGEARFHERMGRALCVRYGRPPSLMVDHRPHKSSDHAHTPTAAAVLWPNLRSRLGGMIRLLATASD